MMRTNRRTKGKFRVAPRKIQGLGQSEVIALQRDLANIFYGREIENPELVKRYTVEVPLSRVESIPIEDYLEDDRDYIESMTVAYEDTPEELPPVLLERSIDGRRFNIIDGMHRVSALRLNKRKSVRALVIDDLFRLYNVSNRDAYDD